MYVSPVKLKDKKDVDYFKKRAFELIGVDYPDYYFEQGFIRAFRNTDDEIVGGYAVITEGPLRTVSSLPDRSLLEEDEEDLMEITALWLEPEIKNGFPSLVLWLTFSRDVYVQKSKKYMIYAYDLDNEKLGKLYRLARPTEIFRGTVKMLEGNFYENQEIIEIASRLNVGLLPITAFPNLLSKTIFKRKTFIRDIKLLDYFLGQA